MKKLLIILSLVFVCALLGAMSFDEAIDEVYSTGQLDKVDGDTYWVTKNYLATEDEAYYYTAYVAGLFLYVQADWESVSNSGRKNTIKAAEGIGAYWMDTEEDIAYLISIPMEEIVDQFETEEYYEMDFDELVDEILEYVNYYGDVSAF